MHISCCSTETKMMLAIKFCSKENVLYLNIYLVYLLPMSRFKCPTCHSKNILVWICIISFELLLLTSLSYIAVHVTIQGISAFQQLVYSRMDTITYLRISLSTITPICIHTRIGVHAVTKKRKDKADPISSVCVIGECNGN